jgi:hypothetical protein
MLQKILNTCWDTEWVKNLVWIKLTRMSHPSSLSVYSVISVVKKKLQPQSSQSTQRERCGVLCLGGVNVILEIRR